MSWIPVVVMLALTCFAVGIDTANHGQPKKGKIDAWTMVLAGLIQMALIIWAAW